MITLSKTEENIAKSVLNWVKKNNLKIIKNGKFNDLFNHTIDALNAIDAHDHETIN